MSGKLLKALMQLFAIVARPGINASDRRPVVEAFLRQQLPYEIARHYLSVFDEFLAFFQKKSAERKLKRISSSAVKILRICSSINKELTNKQKYIVLLRLIEFVNTENEISKQENDFLNLVTESFHLSNEEMNKIKLFVTRKEQRFADELVIAGDEGKMSSKQVMIREALDGEIVLLPVLNMKLFFLKYEGNAILRLNNREIFRNRFYVFENGASIHGAHIQPIYYSEVLNYFNTQKIGYNFVLKADRVTFQYKDSLQGVQEVSSQMSSGSLVAIMGASGSGKTTFLNLLSGLISPAQGSVSINNINIHSEDKRLHGLTGYVAQEDRLFDHLTVFQNLYYTTALCFKDYHPIRIKRLCIEMLKQLDLYDIRHQRVGDEQSKKTSGGQRKRLNIAMELIREPAVLFLDEPTSGLSSKDSEKIIDLLKDLSHKGKLIVSVVHQPSSQVFKMFDQLLIFDREGYVIYDGNPLEAASYFRTQSYYADCSTTVCESCGNINPEEILDLVEATVVDEYGKSTSFRKVSPLEWHLKFKANQKNKNTGSNADLCLPKVKLNVTGFLNQLWIFLLRDFLSKIARKQYLRLSFWLTPLLALVLSVMIKYTDSSEGIYDFSENPNIVVFLFIAVIVAIFIGLSSAGEEIIQDQKILEREKFLRLNRLAYLLSKSFISAFLSLYQSFIFVLIANSILGISGMYLAFWALLFSTWFCANLLIMNVSDAVKSSLSVYIIIPFIIIPQIVFSGVLIRFNKLNPSYFSATNVPVVGEMMISRWSFEALAVHQFYNNKYQKETGRYDGIISNARYFSMFLIPELESEARKVNKDDIQATRLFISNYKTNLNEVGILTDRTNYLKIDSVKDLLKVRKKFYHQVLTIAQDKRDSLISELTSIYGQEGFRAIKQKYYNKGLDDFLRNSNDEIKLIRSDKGFVRNTDLIFVESDSGFFSAQYFTPFKNLFGHKVSTFISNLLFIWLINLLLFIMLQNRLLYRFMKYSSYLKHRFFDKREKVESPRSSWESKFRFL